MGKNSGAIVLVCGILAVIVAMSSGLMMLFVPAAFAGIAGTIAQNGNGTEVASGTCPTNLTTQQLFAAVRKTNDEPPKLLIPVYQAAAAKYKLGPLGPGILAGINYNESDFGRNPALSVDHGVASSGAAGPMEFGVQPPIGDVWSTYGVDGNGDGKKDVYNLIDAIYGAAHLLHTLNGPQDWTAALDHYSGGASGYASSAIANAKKWNIPENPGATCVIGADNNPATPTPHPKQGQHQGGQG